MEITYRYLILITYQNKRNEIMLQEIRTEIRWQLNDNARCITKKYLSPIEAILGLAYDLGFDAKKVKNKIVIG